MCNLHHGDSPRTAVLVGMDDFVIDHLDRRFNAVAVPAQRVFRHALFVLRRQLLGYCRLHVRHGGPVCGSLFHRINQIRQITAEER